MKKILTLLFVSVLGGIITLSAYKLWIEKDSKFFVATNEAQPTFIPTNKTTSNLLYNADSVDFTQAAENAVHAVVHVKNTTVSQGGPVTLQDLFYGRSQPRTQVGTGSGVIISPDGYIITNNHVINGARQLSITLNDNKIYPAKLIGTDEKTDIALLKIDADDDLPYVTFGDSDQAKVGEWVLAVGNPFNLTSTVTAGIISAKSRDLSGVNAQSFIQTDAAVNPGNSGGALVNINGDLIGINTAITSQTGSYIGYSFAVPSNIARKVVEDIMEFGDVQTGILGVNILNRNSKYAIENGLNEIDGVYVSGIEENSGADKAGLKNGDIIKRIDNIRISKFADLSGYLNTKRPNDVVKVTIQRDGNEKIIPVTLSKYEISSVEYLDMQLKNIPKQAKEKYNIDNGVLVIKNNNYSLYKNLGINEGYVITEINGEKINSVEDINKLQQKYGDNLTKISVINTNGQKESFIFR
ncbi:trypsin-like peptidase domain-containing protein [Subsaxibacter sp. CAU 1640]|uniref:trypsin-like peptidase domain-containing protein n=1 Tax=Subsaxibacter sp. CAU 1640 TaxID=2933271 RepID=UPI002004F06D|nr:trypsin-like peptidase domain-containing protein [Subsaxibacter sp. CAU 1640]MCK7590863.1 trypsin-like peptidase domain-containing protein [Subsaxibacter sp. CAU 1640]